METFISFSQPTEATSSSTAKGINLMQEIGKSCYCYLTMSDQEFILIPKELHQETTESIG